MSTDMMPRGNAEGGENVVTVLLQPEERRFSLRRPKTVRRLLDALGLMEETALVARGGELLTPDRRIWPGDELLVRVVTSAG